MIVWDRGGPFWNLVAMWWRAATEWPEWSKWSTIMINLQQRNYPDLECFQDSLMFYSPAVSGRGRGGGETTITKLRVHRPDSLPNTLIRHWEGRDPDLSFQAYSNISCPTALCKTISRNLGTIIPLQKARKQELSVHPPPLSEIRHIGALLSILVTSLSFLRLLSSTGHHKTTKSLLS